MTGVFQPKGLTIGKSRTKDGRVIEYFALVKSRGRTGAVIRSRFMRASRGEQQYALERWAQGARAII